MNQASVISVSRSAVHGFSKPVDGSITILAGLGVEGDAHAGVTVRHRYVVRRNPNAPNLCQVHLLQAELFAELHDRHINITPGQMGENITTTGLDLLSLPLGTRLHLGADAIVELTGLRTPCRQMNDLRPGLMQACIARDPQGRVIRKAGVMALAVATGIVRAGEAITIELPPGRPRPLGPV